MRTLDEFARNALDSDHGLTNVRAETERLRDGDMLLWLKGDEGYTYVQMPEGVIRLPCPCYITGDVTSIPLFHSEANRLLKEYTRQLEQFADDHICVEDDEGSGDVSSHRDGIFADFGSGHQRTDLGDPGYAGCEKTHEPA